MKLEIIDTIIDALRKEIENNTIQMAITSPNAVMYINNHEEGYTEGDVAFFHSPDIFLDDVLHMGEINERAEHLSEFIENLEIASDHTKIEVLSEIDSNTNKKVRVYRFVYSPRYLDDELEPYSIDDDFRIYLFKTSIAFDRLTATIGI
ncbi:hypothetical protein [Pontibacter virosus]|uniref:Uncharacterized protein n=1 Tax=Pontibacter virosus TaxID=1765052 RepID=A0A2U1B2D5_9BACT|nr:hypothetical protein [Pontibacter virosus]PVY42835.1 hypothetical protein C8E01_1028 [Pontibacter virosus]